MTHPSPGAQRIPRDRDNRLPEGRVGVASGSEIRASEHVAGLFGAVCAATITLFPFAVFKSPASRYVGIAAPALNLYTYTFTVALALAVCLIVRPAQTVRALAIFLPFLVGFAYLWATSWVHSPKSTSGALHMLLAVGAFAAGYSQGVMTHFTQGVFRTLSCVAILELAVSVAAIAGYDIWPFPHLAPTSSRAVGTVGDPGQLSKLLLLAAIASLLLESTRRLDRYLMWLGYCSALVGVGLTQSRAGLIGQLALLLIYAVVRRPNEAASRRERSLLAAGILIGLAALPAVMLRFADDPAGGARPYLSQVAWSAIADYGTFGVGPNMYVTVVGFRDPLTASGVPVHNGLLLSAVELGVPLATLFFAPFVILLGQAIFATLFQRADLPDASAIAAAAVPALIIAAVTGWGLLQAPILELTALVLGAILSTQGQLSRNARPS